MNQADALPYSYQAGTVNNVPYYSFFINCRIAVCNFTIIDGMIILVGIKTFVGLSQSSRIDCRFVYYFAFIMDSCNIQYRGTNFLTRINFQFTFFKFIVRLTGFVPQNSSALTYLSGGY